MISNEMNENHCPAGELCKNCKYLEVCEIPAMEGEKGILDLIYYIFTKLVISL